MALRTLFKESFPTPEGFEVANQGVTRRAPGEGPEGTTDAQEMIATDKAGPTTITWNPGEYGADVDKILASMHGFETLRDKLKEAGAYEPVTLDFHEAEELKSCLGGFLNSRTYTKPTVEFAQDILNQLNPDTVNEEFALWTPGKSAPPVDPQQREEPSAAAQDPVGPSATGKQTYPYLYGDVTPQMYDRYAQENGRPARSENEVRWWMASRGYDMNEEVDLEKSSEKEHEEHPWLSKAQAYQVAQDHKSEGKMESVFRKK